MNNSAPVETAPLTLLSIVIPARDEEGCIVSTVQHLHLELQLRGVPHEIIVVDDGSSDETWPMLQQQAQCMPELHPVQNPGPHGFGRAIIYGIDQMKGDAAVIMMADESDDCRDAVLYWKKLNEGYDCVFGSRFMAGGGVIDYPWIKLLVNRLANFFIRMLFNIRLNDTTNAFKAYRKTALDGCRPFLAAHFNLTVELPLKAIVRGFTWTTMPITWRNRRTGEAKLKIKEMGSRYLFICLYIWLEKYFSRGDYRSGSAAEPAKASLSAGLETGERPSTVWRFRNIPILLFAIALLIYLHKVGIGWNHTIGEHHGFRQSQTAISTYYVVKDLAVGKIKMNYETPILGTPWSIPMEFPLFQWITGFIVYGLHTPLDRTGRFVSVFFYLLTLGPVYLLLGKCRVAVPHRFLMLTLLLASPFYTYWSRTFMIETCALFFATSYLASVAWAMERRTAAAIIAACGLGAIAALVKITTVLPFAGLAGLMALWGRFGGQSKRGGFWGNLGLAAILTAVPMAAGIVWAHHADAVKNRNPMANFILSGSLNGWNFGSLSQRVNYHTWNTIFSRIPTLFSNGNLFWAECIAALILLVFCRRRGKEALVCTAFFLLSPAIFINLQFIHDYYMCANGIFLLAGGGFLLIAAAENKRWQPIAYALCGFAVVAGAMGHRACFRPFQKRDETSMLPLALKIRESTSPDAVNIYSGFDWNPIVPYYSGRRALMLCNKADGSQATTAIQKLRDKKVGVVVIGPDSRWSKDWLERTMRESGVKADRIWLLSKTDTPVLL